VSNFRGAPQQAETGRFGAQRVHRALEARTRLMGCRSANDVHEAYLRDLAED
jgi:hypothetical protein